ncbi:methylmalonyl Co-A mutase-associated GTPase MeaB [Reichenbachiella sp. MALMAid0571]|uniref:methylmalonyl Co-A mutase-associated GTPase MeaB n=1 Tax=Reichenbachiella sp. MALMAid0571 TaxID=3143939 RepID=UPI0032DEF4CF
MKNNRQSVDYYIKGILKGDKFILSKSITIIESSLPEDVDLSIKILNGISGKSGISKRIGITGVPGVGKSTFIEAFGGYLISKGNKVAVLAIDPTSSKTGGSILGDKTRMNDLSRNENAFIRPSPANNTLGGVSDHTRENILLCEAAGYDVIIVETVGVGQSETLVRGMVDFFLLLMLPGAGDDLQGMKKGIMEMADGIVINKADGDNIYSSNQAQLNYQSALHLFSVSESGWIPRVITCSSVNKSGIKEVWEMILDHYRLLEGNGYLKKLRIAQNVDWFRGQISQELVNKIFENEAYVELRKQLEHQVSSEVLNPKEALTILFNKIFSRR